MATTARGHSWSKFLDFYTELNAGRVTRLAVFRVSNGVVNDEWLEDGMPLERISFEPENGRPTVRIIVGTLVHEVTNVRALTAHFDTAGDEDGLDIVDGTGVTTILRFER